MSEYITTSPNTGNYSIFGDDIMKVSLHTNDYGTVTYDGMTHTYTKTQENRVNLTTKVVQLKAGFVGQVHHGLNIVWESKPKKTLAKADKAANKAKDRAVARLFEEN